MKDLIIFDSFNLFGKPISFSDHALDRMSQRGATTEEVSLTINGPRVEDAKDGRKKAMRSFAVPQTWAGKSYEGKTLEVIFDDGETVRTVITVIVYWGK